MDKGEQILERITQRDEIQMIPRYLPDTRGLVTVDITWGEIQTMKVSDGIRTVGEPEVIKHLQNGLPVIDVRAPGTRHGVRIAGKNRIPISDIVDRIDELEGGKAHYFLLQRPAVFTIAKGN